MTRDEVAPPTQAELKEAEWRAAAFNAEAARSGLFAAALDMAEAMKDSGIPNAEAALLTGAVEFVAQLWQQVGLAAGIPRATTRKLIEKELRFYLNKHAEPAPKATMN